MTNRNNDEAGPNLYAVGALGDRWIYEFACPVCGASGKIAVPKWYKAFDCPNNEMTDTRQPCPAKYLQWKPPEAKPIRAALRIVNETEAKVALDLARINRRVNGSGPPLPPTLRLVKGN